MFTWYVRKIDKTIDVQTAVNYAMALKDFCYSHKDCMKCPLFHPTKENGLKDACDLHGLPELWRVEVENG